MSRFGGVGGAKHCTGLSACFFSRQLYGGEMYRSAGKKIGQVDSVCSLIGMGELGAMEMMAKE